MLQVGDVVRFRIDGTLGVVIKVHEKDCYVLWEDGFSSLELYDELIKDENWTARQRIDPRHPCAP
ncbi:hypothetical protein CathTA2_1990 [Caldalkalibacillus thermarum TA2.A1]|uniref:DUF2158 domain-containing protein n=1 Tax=Caldalkalibacillus thermarum (strain TA2.A1) TaxID=986075 RepID=F5L840_CALTT|nr:hypothetical protein [Caldalkalibacillus thermarum]EGL82453.1 hypothetical protein CathTA2_1990 [Caldalkalibacillus thermarum TA2.A1]QZT33195.1 hypothetical protein HUR95_12935 [Caldalkalibacillus thermarum TA2.A1]